MQKGKGKPEGRGRRNRRRGRNNWQEYSTGHNPSQMGPCNLLPEWICRHCGQDNHWGNECELHQRDTIAARELKEATEIAQAKAEAKAMMADPNAVISWSQSTTVIDT